MSFQDAEQHATKAVGYIKSGNAAKAMHHIGHAMVHLRAKTSAAGGAGKIPSMSNKGAANAHNGPSQPSGAGIGVTKGPAMIQPANDPTDAEPNDQAMKPATGLRARLSGMGK